MSTAHEMGWSEFDNVRLLAAAEETFDVLVTTDRNLRHQQSMTGRRLAVLVLPTTSWPKIRAQVTEVARALDGLRAGELKELEWSP